MKFVAPLIAFSFDSGVGNLFPFRRRKERNPGQIIDQVKVRPKYGFLQPILKTATLAVDHPCDNINRETLNVRYLSYPQLPELRTTGDASTVGLLLASLKL